MSYYFRLDCYESEESNLWEMQSDVWGYLFQPLPKNLVLLQMEDNTG